uniref:Helicase ATP-binding domain-containing protein n=1 Tax=Panagrellus redivivus TaxID=6233 RepID=A0A7E4WBQ3_PANRE
MAKNDTGLTQDIETIAVAPDDGLLGLVNADFPLVTVESPVATSSSDRHPSNDETDESSGDAMMLEWPTILDNGIDLIPDDYLDTEYNAHIEAETMAEVDFPLDTVMSNEPAAGNGGGDAQLVDDDAPDSSTAPGIHYEVEPGTSQRIYPANGFKIDKAYFDSLPQPKFKVKVFSKDELKPEAFSKATPKVKATARKGSSDVAVEKESTEAEPARSRPVRVTRSKAKVSEAMAGGKHRSSSEEEVETTPPSSSDSEEEKIVFRPKKKRAQEETRQASEDEDSDVPKKKKKRVVISDDSEFEPEDGANDDDDEVVAIDEDEVIELSDGPSSSTAPPPRRANRSTRQSTAAARQQKLQQAKSKRAVIEDDDDDDDFVITMPKRKRRGRAPSTSEEEEEEDEEEDSDADETLLNDSDLEIEDENSKKNRKGVKTRKILTRDKLAQETIDAEEAERERRRRLEERQKEYNGILISNVEGDEGYVIPKLKQIVLDDDRGAEKPNPVSVHEHLVKVLMPHQADGIKFMYDNAFESLERFRKDDQGGGCILAHCMGLGKTLQVVAFVHTVLSHPELSAEVPKVLIVVPKNVVLNWRNEFEKWLSRGDANLETFDVMELDSFKSDEDRRMCLKNWHRGKNPSVMIMGYDMFRILTQREEDRPPPPKPRNGKPPKPKKVTHKMRKFMEMQKEFRKYLQDPGPDMIICDEGHKLKNDESQLSKTMMRITTRRRVCLTGTPLQNNLMEYHVMVNFVKPGLLGLKSEFANRFSNIIDRGRTSDASPAEVSLMKRRCHVLFERLKHVVQRRDISILKAELPPKLEYVVMVRMTPAQIKLYDHFLQVVDREGGIRGSRKRLLPDYHIMSRIWTHPYQLISHARELERQRILKGDDLEDFIDDSDGSGSDSDASLSDGDDNLDDNAQPRKGTRSSRRLGGEEASDRESPIEEVGWWTEADAVTEDDKTNWAMSNKLMLLMDIIKACERVGDKLLVFSQSLESMRLIKNMLEHLDKTKQWFVDGHETLSMGQTWGWKEGYDYLVIDGSVQAGQREYLQQRFNKPTNLRARLMLISTRAGSLGTNMIAANRVVIFDACWNPSHDTQSLFRVYRIGQKKPTFIYRFIAQGTMEERIYNRQVTKESTSLRVVDEHQIQRHFDIHDLEELYRFEPVPYVAGDELKLDPPKDRLLADLIRARPQGIVTYIPHDTLFVNQADEELTEEERKAAWDDYELEKRGINVSALNPMLNNALNQDVMTEMGLNLQMALGIPQGAICNGVPIEATDLKNLEMDPIYWVAKNYNYTPMECAKLGYIKMVSHRLIFTALPDNPTEVATRIQKFIIENVNNHSNAIYLSMLLFHSLLEILKKYPSTQPILFRISRFAPWLLTPPVDRHGVLNTERHPGASGSGSGTNGNAPGGSSGDPITL